MKLACEWIIDHVFVVLYHCVQFVSVVVDAEGTFKMQLNPVDDYDFNFSHHSRQGLE